jgi:hypothetical protein
MIGATLVLLAGIVLVLAVGIRQVDARLELVTRRVDAWTSTRAPARHTLPASSSSHAWTPPRARGPYRTGTMSIDARRFNARAAAERARSLRDFRILERLAFDPDATLRDDEREALTRALAALSGSPEFVAPGGDA